jgi:hypothetical protein
MSEHTPPTAQEVERLALLRDPPAPPGYVDPLESSPLLEDGGPPGPQAHEGAPGDPEPRRLP